MLNDLTPKIIESSEVIDEMISQYFANRLGVKDPKTINALGKDGKLTFNQKIELFCGKMLNSRQSIGNSRQSFETARNNTKGLLRRIINS